MNLFISPLEQFEVIPLISLIFHIFNNFSFVLSNFGFYSILVLILTIILHIASFNSNEITVDNSNVKVIPSRWSIALESSYATLHNMVKEQIGSANEIYLPFIYGLFFFILISNLTGNIPYSYALGTSAIASLGLSFTIFLGCTILGLNKHGVHFFSYFVPAGTPFVMVPLLVLVELISYIARAFSLGIRLFANLVAGHTLLKILSGFIYPMFSMSVFVAIVAIIPMALFTALIGLEIAVSLIQAYVFTILTCIYLKDAIDLH